MQKTVFKNHTCCLPDLILIRVHLRISRNTQKIFFGLILITTPFTGVRDATGNDKADVAHIARMEKIADHALVPPIVNTSPLPEYGYDQLDYRMTIKLSDDEGLTWSASRTLEAGFSGYSDLAALPDGTILCFYERGSTDRQSHYRTGRLTVACVTEEWVRAGIDIDVCVYGGTSGGVVAAVQAARMGKRVVLVEPSGHLGGMTSGGLSAVDIGDPRSVGGIAREYFTRLVATYGKRLQWDQPFRAKVGRLPAAPIRSNRMLPNVSLRRWLAKLASSCCATHA